MPEIFPMIRARSKGGHCRVPGHSGCTVAHEIQSVRRERSDDRWKCEECGKPWTVGRSQCQTCGNRTREIDSDDG